MEIVLFAFVGVIALFVVITLIRSVRIVPQQQNHVVERLGKYQRTLTPGLNLLVPFIDNIRAKIDLREAVVSFPPQPVITSDNLVVSIDTVLYYKVVDPVRATYEIQYFLQAIEQLTVTTLRNVIGSLDLEKALTSRDQINRHLSTVLDETTGRWGVKVTRVEIKAIEPPPSIRDSMEKQMRAERDRRAAILTAEGHKQSQILTAEGEKQAAVLRAEGERQSRMLTAEGQAKAIRTVVDAIHAANPDAKVLAYQFMSSLPQIASGQANKIWFVPSELNKVLDGIGGALGNLGQLSEDDRRRVITELAAAAEESDDIREATEAAAAAAAAATAEAQAASAEASGNVGTRALTASTVPATPAWRPADAVAKADEWKPAATADETARDARREQA